MNDLAITRLTATVRPTPGHPDERSRVERMLRHLGERRLDDRMRRSAFPDGEWCVRRVDVELNCDLDDHDATIESRWADTLLESLRRVLDGAVTADVVHYRDRHAALEALVASVATGRTEHAWAWRQVGLLNRSDPSHDHDPAGAILTALGRVPEHALQAVVGAVHQTGLAGLHRVLGVDGWRRLAMLVVRSAGLSEREAETLLQGAERTDGTSLEGTDDISTRALRLLSESDLAAVMRRSGLRPGGARSPWAVLVVTEADPVALRLSCATALIGVVERALSPAGLAAPSGLVTDESLVTTRCHEVATLDRSAKPKPGSPGGVVDPESAGSSLSAEPRHTALPETLDLQEPQWTDPVQLEGAGVGEVTHEDDVGIGERRITEWSGLLFLLTTAAEAGMPDHVVDDLRLQSRSVRWVMHELAFLLVPIGAGDPAALAFAGLPPDAEPPGGTPATDVERLALVELATRWSDATARRLDLSTANRSELVSRVAQKRGEIVGERGWIEVHLNLEDVDIEIRRAGLDLDPGWVPWLGVVVRFIYG